LLDVLAQEWLTLWPSAHAIDIAANYCGVSEGAARSSPPSGEAVCLGRVDDHPRASIC
jgi:hypothetical protein